MDQKKRKALEAAGFRVGDVKDFLDLTEEESRLVELRVAISRAIRRLREKQRLTQEQLAAKMKSSQSRVAKIEAGGSGVSLDLLFRGLFAVGGGVGDLTAARTKKRKAGKVQTAQPRKKPTVPAGT